MPVPLLHPPAVFIEKPQANGYDIGYNNSSERIAYAPARRCVIHPKREGMEIKVTDGSPGNDLKDQTIAGTRLPTKPAVAYLLNLSDERREAILRFHADYSDLIEQSRGSKTKHQAWQGGYVDHLGEIFRIAEASYSALSAIRPLPFTLDAAVIVLYFHDVEKIWKYTTGLPADFDKDRYYDETLKTVYGIVFSEEERNGLHYIHGESDSEYDPHVRKAGPLAAFCHAADILSARMWFDEGRGLGV